MNDEPEAKPSPCPAQGFRYLKLDFLYCAALPGHRYDPGVTRAQAMHTALRIMREAAGEGVFLMGCSVPIGAAIGYMDR